MRKVGEMQGMEIKTHFKPDKLTKAEKDKMNSEVRVRDRHCQKCGVWALGGGVVHHKKSRGAHGDAAWTMDNMILMCVKCHDLIHRGGK